MSDRYDFQHFRSELREAGILWVSLDRPERRNAISPEMHAEMAPLFARIAADADVRVVVITGAGDKAFSVGADFGGMQENLDAGGYQDGHPGLMVESAGIVRAQLSVRQPIIAAVNGDAIGLGATLALFCDLVLMADHARSGDPHVKAGIVAGDGGAILWPLLLGPHRGKEVLMLGDLMGAQQAHSLGPAVVGSQTYITSLDVDPHTQRYLYYVAGAHGGSQQDGTPLVQFDIRTRTRKVIAFLHPFCHTHFGYIAQGTYALAVSPLGDRVYITWNGNRGTPSTPSPRKPRFNTCALTVIHVPAAERQP